MGEQAIVLVVPGDGRWPQDQAVGDAAVVQGQQRHHDGDGDEDQGEHRNPGVGTRSAASGDPSIVLHRSPDVPEQVLAPSAWRSGARHPRCPCSHTTDGRIPLPRPADHPVMPWLAHVLLIGWQGAPPLASWRPALNTVKPPDAPASRPGTATAGKCRAERAHPPARGRAGVARIASAGNAACLAPRHDDRLQAAPPGEGRDPRLPAAFAPGRRGVHHR